MTDHFDYKAAVAATAAAMLAKAKDDESFARAIAAVGVVVKGMQAWGGLLPTDPAYGLKKFHIAESNGHGLYHLSAFGRDVFDELGFGPETDETPEGETGADGAGVNAQGAGGVLSDEYNSP